MARLELAVTAAQNDRTVRSLLKYELGLSTARINRLKRTETGLTVNGVRVFTNAVLHAGDRLTVDLESVERPSSVTPIPMELDILFEDQHLLILNKPAPLAVIPSSLSPEEPALAGAVTHYLGPGAAFHPVNRLDRGTTGLMAVAKNGFVHDRLRRILHTGEFFRQYQAVCTGVPQPPEGTIDLPIGRAPGSAIRRQILPGGQPAQTEYRLLSAGGGYSLVELTPHTGRTHQLRVHMAALGCPLAGDWLYGTEGLISRPALHAARLSFTHPLTGQRLAFTAPLPEDMNIVLERFVCPT
ncbi:MAG: RluA family pseudouridine synthase [Oscillospiraceae bacterium]|nr:RluA family pseudouridine synthase [Oscillospiraceae bacterium]